MFDRSSLLFGAAALLVCGSACEGSGPTVIAAPQIDTSLSSDTLTETTLPVLELTSPARGTWLTGPQRGADPGQRRISGYIDHPLAESAIVRVNGVDTSITQGAFETEGQYSDGINVISVRVETADGARAVDGRAVFAGDVYPAGAVIEEAIQIHASPQFLDDDNNDPDDIASIAVAALSADGALDGALQPIDTSYAELKPTKIQFTSIDLDIIPLQGAVEFIATVTDFSLLAEVQGKGQFDALLSGDAQISSSEVTLTLVLSVEVVQGTPSVVTEFTELLMNDFALQSDAIDALVDEYPTLGQLLISGGALNNLVEEYVSDTFQDVVGSLFQEILTGFLESFAYDTSFGEDPSIDLQLTLASVQFTPLGLDISLSAGISSVPSPNIPLIDGVSGSLVTPDLGQESAIQSEAPLWFVINDDLLNQFIFSYWVGGNMSGITLEGASLPLTDPESIPQVFRPLRSLEFDALLPPSAVPQSNANPDYPFLFGLGDLLITINTDAGRSFRCSLNARTGLWFDIQDAQIVSPLIDASPKNMDLAVGCDDVPEGFDPGSVAALLRVGLPPLLRDATNDFKIAVPSLPVGELIPLDALKNATLAFDSLNATVHGNTGQKILIEASPVMKGLSGRRVP